MSDFTIYLWSFASVVDFDAHADDGGFASITDLAEVNAAVAFTKEDALNSAMQLFLEDSGASPDFLDVPHWYETEPGFYQVSICSEVLAVLSIKSFTYTKQ